MKSLVTRDGLVKILIMTAVLIALFPFSPTGQQLRNLAAARKHAHNIQPQLNNDTRFRHVRVGGYTGGGGMFWVFGTVSTDADFAELKRMITATKPPVAVYWEVRVLALPSDRDSPR